jgi:hypothetical protein
MEDKMDEKKLEELRALDPMELMKKKASAVQELDKQWKSMLSVDVAKASERAKLDKVMQKIQDQLKNVQLVELVLKEKDF